MTIQFSCQSVRALTHSGDINHAVTAQYACHKC